MKIEIVSTALANDLLEGAGTGACPEGATMDLLKPQICPPGEGLQQTWKNAVPCARAVTWMILIHDGHIWHIFFRVKYGYVYIYIWIYTVIFDFFTYFFLWCEMWRFP